MSFTVNYNPVKGEKQKRMDNSACSILILSCDKNISLLNIFEACFKKNWRDCPFPTYIGLERCNKEYDGWITLQSKEIKWGKRTKDYLNRINTKYVIIILDDFVVEETVDTDAIMRFLTIMSDDKIASISLVDIFDNDNEQTPFEGIVKRKWNANYLLNLQVGIWNTTTLISLIKDKESPWQTELFGSIRARKLREKAFLCLKSDDISPYKYGRGWLMVRGIWNGNEIKRLELYEYAVDLFDGRDIVYSNLMHIDLLARVKRRAQIEIRKLLSVIGIYL